MKQSEEYDERGLFGSKSQAWWRLDFDRLNNQKNMMREDCLGPNNQKRATYTQVIGLEFLGKDQ